MEAEKKYHDTMHNGCIDIFKDHELIEANEVGRRWYIARRHEDGTVKGDFATEIISLRRGKLFVGGDIPNCVFAHFGGNFDDSNYHIAKIAWIGRHKCVDVYIREKAEIGMNDHNSVMEYDAKVARDDLISIMSNLIEKHFEYTHRIKQIKRAFDSALYKADNEQEMLEVLHNNDPGLDLWEYNNIGIVTSSRVYFAWAACRRLCELLGE
jgi:hypothetical protein